MLAEPNTFLAAWLAARAADAVVRLNHFPVVAVVVIVVYVPMLGRILLRSRVVRRDLCHEVSFPPARDYAGALVFLFLAQRAFAACAAIGLGIWNISLHHRLDHAQEALRGVPLTGAKGSVVVSGGSGALVVSDLAPAPAGKTYEAWVVQGEHASPAGTFAGGGRTIVIRLTRDLPAGAVVAVTLERAGGVDQPTTKPFITSQPV